MRYYSRTDCRTAVLPTARLHKIYNRPIADLEFITEFCDGPDIFLNYIEKRLEIQKLDIPFWGDELDLLSAYLTNRLQKENLWERGGEKFTAFMLTGLSEIFDRWMWYKNGLISEGPKISLDIPEEIKEILEFLRSKNDDDSKLTAFNLLSVSDSVLREISVMLIHFRSKELNWGTASRGSVFVGDVLVVGIGGFGISISDLIQKVKALAKSKEEIQKANTIIVFAAITNQNARPIEYIDIM